MDPMTITWIAVSVGSLILGHLGILKPLLPSPKPAPLPTTIGHGEILAWLKQELANLIAQQPVAPVSPVGPAPAPAIDVHQLLEQIFAFLQAMGLKLPAPPAPPKA
jgi:hypothetical protein